MKTTRKQRLIAYVSTGVVGALAISLAVLIGQAQPQQPYNATYSPQPNFLPISKTNDKVKQGVDIQLSGFEPGKRVHFVLRTDDKVIHSETVSVGKAGSIGVAVAVPADRYAVDVYVDGVLSATSIEPETFAEYPNIQLRGSYSYPSISWDFTEID